MIIISHRGNTDGPSPKDENTKKSIKKCLDLGYDVEIDVWFEKNKFYLGHDEPTESITPEFLNNDKLWIHLKNIKSVQLINEIKPKNFFWHENDTLTLTSSNKIWLYPKIYINSKDAIFVLPEQDEIKFKCFNYKCFGICTDFVYLFDKKYKDKGKKHNQTK